MSGAIRLNVRAVIQKDAQVLQCRFVTGRQHYFFPGGGVEYNETAIAALRRELKEELGVKMLGAEYMGAVENIWDHNGTPYHELNLVFSVSVDDDQGISKEEQIAFAWIPIAKLETEEVLPKPLASAVVQWFKDKKQFWVGME